MSRGRTTEIRVSEWRAHVENAGAAAQRLAVLSFAGARAANLTIIGEHDAILDRVSDLETHVKFLTHHIQQLLAAGGAVTPGQTPGVDAARDAGLRPEPRARVGVAASVAAAVQPLPAARAVRDGRADGCAAAAAASA